MSRPPTRWRDSFHKLNHHRQAGPHGGARKPELDEDEAVEDSLSGFFDEEEGDMDSLGKLEVYPTAAHLPKEGYKLFEIACGTDDRAGGVSQVCDDIRNGKYNLFYWTSPRSRVVIITSIVTRNDRTTDLYVNMLAGDNASVDFDEVVETLKKVAEHNQCRKVVAMVKSELWEAFKRHGAHADSEYVVIESEV